MTREPVFVGKPAANGELPELSLDGGQRYEIACGGVTIPFAAVSGTTYRRQIDLARVIVLSAEKPKYVHPNQQFAIKLQVANRGLKPASTKIVVLAEDASTEVGEQTVTVGAGETKDIPWPFVAGDGNRPYVLFFEPDGDRTTGLDVTGAILR